MQTIPFNPSTTVPFSFSPELDGETYFCEMEWLSVTERWWLRLINSNQSVICYQPLIASCDCRDIQLFAQLKFKTNIVYRASAKAFEIGGVYRDDCPESFIPVPPSYTPPPVWVCYPSLSAHILSDNVFSVDYQDLTSVFVSGVRVSFTGLDTGTVYGTVVSSTLEGMGAIVTIVTLAMDGTSSLYDVSGETTYVVCRVREQIYITADLTDIHGVFDPDFVDDNIVTFTLHAANAANGDVYQWRLVGGDPDNFCPWVDGGSLTIDGGLASCTVHAATAYDFPARNTPFIIIVSQNDVDLCSSPVVINWSFGGCGA